MSKLRSPHDTAYPVKMPKLDGPGNVMKGSAPTGKAPLRTPSEK